MPPRSKGKDNSRKHLKDMSWPEVKKFNEDGSAIVVVPTGSTEQHGPHLPVDTDSFLVNELAALAVERVQGRVKVILTPLVPYGASSLHAGFPGTVYLSPRLFVDSIVELCMALTEQGFRKILLINGHGGNFAPLVVAARSVRDKTKMMIAVANYWDLVQDDLRKTRESELGGIGHSDELETSLMLALRPEAVRKEFVVKEIHHPKTTFLTRDNLVGRGLTVVENISDYSVSGVIGDPTVASAEKGKKWVELIVEKISKLLIEMKDWEVGNL